MTKFKKVSDEVSCYCYLISGLGTSYYQRFPDGRALSIPLIAVRSQKLFMLGDMCFCKNDTGCMRPITPTNFSIVYQIYSSVHANET